MIEVTIQEQQHLYYPLWRFAQGQWWYCEQAGEVVSFAGMKLAEHFLHEVCARLVANGVVVRRLPACGQEGSVKRGG